MILKWKILATLFGISFGWALFWFITNGSTVFFDTQNEPETKIDTSDLPTAELLFGGDVMFDRNVRKNGELYGYDFLLSPIKDFLADADLTIINLEGPVTNYPSKTFVAGKTTTSLTFTFDPKVATVLKNIGVDVVSLANNHTDNFGPEGFLQTKDNLDKSGVKWFGSPTNQSATERTFEINGMKIALVGYHEFQQGIERTLADVFRLSKDHFVIVMPHWGEEYASSSNARIQSKAVQFVNAGADAIIGAHAHVVLESEWIGQVPVFYSLGNLLFDQYFSPEVMKGQMVKLTLRKSDEKIFIDKINLYETSTASKKYVELVGEVI